jgi:hypothetical protein
MVLETALGTLLVEITNVVLVESAGTVIVAGTVAGSVLERDTTAPPAGAEPVSLTVPVTVRPPATLSALNSISESPRTAR